MEPKTLTVDELRIRPWQASDIPALTSAFSNPSIYEYMMMPQPWTLKHSRNFIARTHEGWAANSPRWAVVDDTDTLVGGVGLTPCPHDEYAVMYWTAPHARGRNIATRALREVCRFAFDEIDNIHRLHWDAIVGNHLSRLVALKVGFQMEGITREGGNQRGEWRDLWVAGMLRGDLREADQPIDNHERFLSRAALFQGSQPTIDLNKNGARLRPYTEDDIDDHVATCQDPDVQKWTTTPRDFGRDNAEEFLTSCQRTWKLGTSINWVIADKTGRYNGIVGIHMWGWDEYSARISFYTAPWARGTGLMTPALNAIVDFSAHQLRNSRLEWDAYEGNDASWHLAKKVGFVWEGVRQGRWRYDRTKKVDIWKAALIHLGHVLAETRQ